MERAETHIIGADSHPPENGLVCRPTAGAALARAFLEHQAAHRAAEPEVSRWSASSAVLRRVRDALASGGRP
jgi:hypothetical protein